MPRPSRKLSLVALVVSLVLPLMAVPASASGAYDDVIDITFPVDGLDGRNFMDDYHFSRGGGTRVHRATDIGHSSAYGLPVHAAMGGRIRTMTGFDGSPPSWGYAITIDGDDGRRYDYLHLGRQDGPTSEAYAPGLSPGDRVERGQHIGFVGHSGNASAQFPHLHFEIEDPRVTDPYGSNRLNPYASLEAALDRGDIPNGTGWFDVQAGNTHLSAIDAIAEAGITQGCAPRRFCPTAPVTRGQMATFLMRATELEPSSERPFSDVPDGHAHADAIAAVAEAGYAHGDGDGRFHPDRPVRRDQMASLLAAALHLEDRDEHPFSDVNGESVHAGAIAALAHEDIARGDEHGRYWPARDIQRAQMASLLARAFLD